jgi:hypothetical protein
VLSTSPTGNAHDWTSGSCSATRTARSRSPGTSTSRSRSIYTATSPAAGRKTAEKVLESLHLPDPRGRQARPDANGGTEAINGVIEKTRRLAHGFRNFTNYRILLAADGTRPYRRPPTKSRSADEPTQADLRRADILAVHRLVALSRAAR